MVQSTQNPTVISGDATQGFILDRNSPLGSYQAPYFFASFQGIQRIWWSYPCHQNGAIINFLPDIQIDRKVFQDADGIWKYEISKSGETNKAPLP